MTARLSLRGRWRRFALGLPTVLGMKPRGWFIPHRYAPLLPPPGAQPPYPAIEQLFESRLADFTAVIDAVDAQASALEGLKGLLDQSWFPSLDAADRDVQRLKADRERLWASLEEACENAVALDCATVMSGIGPGAAPFDEGVANVRRAGEIVARHGLRLALEYQFQHPIVRNLDILRDLVIAEEKRG